MESSTCEHTTTTTCSAESGWTEYMVAFELSEGRRAEEITIDDQRYPKISFSSDAASLASYAIKKEAVLGGGKLRCRKRKTKEDEEDELEDTASSPVCSPKISKSSGSPSKIESGGRVTQRKGAGPTGKTCGEGNGINGPGKNELRKRGYCLVPFSMFMDLPGWSNFF